MQGFVCMTEDVLNLNSAIHHHVDLTPVGFLYNF